MLVIREESLPNPCTRMDARLNPGMHLEAGSSLDYKYSVNQSLPGGYLYFKW